MKRHNRFFFLSRENSIRKGAGWNFCLRYWALSPVWWLGGQSMQLQKGKCLLQTAPWLMKKPSPDSCSCYTTAKYIHYTTCSSAGLEDARACVYVCININSRVSYKDNHVSTDEMRKKKKVIKSPLKYYIKKYRVAYIHTHTRSWRRE